MRFRRLLLTGAAGALGRELRPRLKRYCDVLRISDREPLGHAFDGEEVQLADLADRTAMHQLLQGVDAVVHLGGISTEQPWSSILAANIAGVVNLYEAVRAHGTRRVVFASSNHVTGFYRQDETIGPRDPMRPDGFYGLSKAFGENLAQLYWDRFGIETVSLRIGSASVSPSDRRMLSTWISYDDTERLVAAALSAPTVGHTVIYGASNNSHTWWDNSSAAHLGFRPQDSSEAYRVEVEAQAAALDPNDPALRYQGGTFVRTGPFL